MRRTIMLTCVTVLSVVLFSNFSMGPNKTKKFVYDTNIQGTNYWFNYSDVHYDPDGDINETPINGYDQAQQRVIGIVICPGKGANCQVIVVVGRDTYVFVAKKTPGGPDYTTT